MILSDEELFARLVSFDTTSNRSNLPLADFICEYLDDPGLSIHRLLSPDRSKANLIVVRSPQRLQSDREGIVLCGHMDVVPAIEEGWHSDPFTLTDTGDDWVARGSADMKGFLALAINSLVRVPTASLSAPLALLLTYDEEVGCLGARQLAESWPENVHLPRDVVIGEPTSLRVVRMNKGHVKLRVSVHGRSAHSGYPHLGINAIEMAAEAIVRLQSLRLAMESERPPNHEFFTEVPFVPLNIGTVQGGTAINIVPDLCEFEVGIRLLPGMSMIDVLARFEEVLRERFSDAELSIALINESPPMLLDESAFVSRAMAHLAGQSGTASVSFATDGGWLQRQGFETVLFGPGSIEVAHRPNEFLPKGEFYRARTVLDSAVDRFCGRL
ncbi:MAG: acetylornithine deacetylase [Acidobacteriota bacterium]